VIIDTDPGIDDALAILLALASPELRVLGLTTVAGNLGLAVTTRNALRILHLAGRDDVPVIAGSRAPLQRTAISVPGVHGDDGLGGVSLPDAARSAEPGEAVAWMAGRIAEAPAGTVRVLALGPLTNLARLIHDHPDAARRLGGIVAMGGAVREPGNAGPRTEFNLAADPHAAAVVFGSGLPVTLVPLDMTRKVRADLDWTAALRSAERQPARVAATLVEAYFTHTERLGTTRESRPLHDPCVVLHAIAPDVFGTERLPIAVETEGPDAGATVVDEGGPAIDVVLSGDPRRALDLLAGRLQSL